MRAGTPELFKQLSELGCIDEKDICSSGDGFTAVKKSMADIMAQRGIVSFPGDNGSELECGLFFDDWYLYAAEGEGKPVYSLFKMREQEDDAKMGRHADGDTPGVTVSFIAMDERLLAECLAAPDTAKIKKLADEINRVAAYGGQSHSAGLKAYFIRTAAAAPYLIAKLYTSYIASLAAGGSLPVPEAYEAVYKKSGPRGRIARFIEENNRNAGRTVCDHKRIFIRDSSCPTEEERLAILATHAGNVSFFSFAAEVQFHALFLTKFAKIRIPFIGKSPYASAIRADMSIADAELTGPTPYYRESSMLVKRQYSCHKKTI